MRLAAALSALFLLCACDQMHTERLRTRSAFDLQCPKEQLRIVTIDSHTRGVSGCDRQATYVEVCKKGEDCTWVKDAETASKIQ